MFDALAGVPGTYTYTNMYVQTSFGFSEELWGVTMNLIDAGLTGYSMPVKVDLPGGGQATAT